MPISENGIPPDLSDAEKIIRALETLVTECEGRKLEGFAKRIQVCLTKCQTDYVASQRREFAARQKKNRAAPKKTTH